MANPQTENGHTQIANEILEHLSMIHLSPNQWQILMCIFRKTYGYRKKTDYITNTQITDITGLGKSVVSRSISDMVGRQILTRNGKNIGFQKDWELWGKVSSIANNQPTEKLAEHATKVVQTANKNDGEKLAVSQPELAEHATIVSNFDNKSCLNTQPQKKKETYTKETIQKKVYGEFQNVFLTDDELLKLQQRFPGGNAERKIENLSSAIASKGYKFKDFYATILNWAHRDEINIKDGQSGQYKTRDSRGLPTHYTTPEELDAIENGGGQSV